MTDTDAEGGRSDGREGGEAARAETPRTMACRNCGASLGAGHIDRALGIVTCAHCGGLHELAGAAGSRRAPARADESATGTSSGSAPERGTVPLPPRFEVRRGEGTLQVRWAKGNKIGALLIAAFAVVWAVAALSVGLVLLLPVSLFLLYHAAVRGLNRTTLRVERSRIGVRRGPLPAPGSTREMARADIVQLFASERVTRSRTGSDGNPQWRENRSYRLEAIDRDGRRRPLVGGLSSPEQALWLEREAEAVLGIENAAVATEYRA